MKRFIILVLLVGTLLLASCEVSEEGQSEQIPTMEEIKPYLIFSEGDHTLIGVNSDLDFVIVNDSLIYLGEKFIGIYQETDE